jgi:hypothetical protein
MNQKAIQDAYNLFTESGYKKSIDDFKSLIKTNPNALNDSYELFKGKGYNKDIESYKSLVGVSEKKSSVSTGTTPQEVSSTPLQGQSTTLGGEDKEKPKPLVTSNGETPKSYKNKIGEEIIYVNKDSKRGVVNEIPKDIPKGYSYKVVSNSEELRRWKEQQSKPKATTPKTTSKPTTDFSSTGSQFSTVKGVLDVTPKATVSSSNKNVSENKIIADNAFNYSNKNASKEKAIERLEDEVNTKQFSDGVIQGLKNVYNLGIAAPLSVINTALGGNKDFTIKKSIPLEVESIQAKKELDEEFKGSSYNPSLIKERAKEIFIDNDILEQKHKLIDEALPIGYDREGIWKELKLEQLKSNDILRGAVASAEVWNGKIEDFTSFASKLDKDGNSVFDAGVTDQDIDTYEKLRVEAEESQKNLLTMSKNYQKYLDKAKNDEEKLELFKYNYNDWEKSLSNIISGTKDIVAGSMKLGINTLFSEGPEGQPSLVRDISEISDEILSETEKDRGQFFRYKATSLNSFGDLGSFMNQLGSEQLPIVGSIILGGGTGVLLTSMSSGGQKIKELEDQAKQPGGIAYSNGKKLLAGWLYAGAEYWPQKFGTQRIIKNLGETIASASTLSKRGLSNTLLKDLPKGIARGAYYSQLEGVSERATAEGQIVIDENLLRIVMTNAEKDEMRAESYLSGSLMGFGMNGVAGAIAFGVAQAKLYSDSKSVKEVKDLMDRINGLSLEVDSNPNLTKQEVASIYTEMNRLTNIAYDIVSANAKKGIDLSIEAKGFLVDIDTRQAQLKDEFSNLPSSNFSQDYKDNRRKEITSEFDLLENKRQSIIGGGFNVLMTLNDKEVFNLKNKAEKELINEAKERGDKEFTFTDKQITERAIENYEKQRKETTAKEPVEKRPTGEQKVETTTTAEGQQDKVLQEAKDNVEALRKEEVAEFEKEVENPQDFITDGKVDANKVDESDNPKAKEIYAKYDAQIKPLLEETKTQEAEVVAEEATDYKVISQKVLDKKELNTVRASLRASSPDSFALEVLDAVAKGEVLGYDSELDSTIESMIENGVSINNVANLILQDDVITEKKGINSKRKAIDYALNIGAKGTILKSGQQAVLNKPKTQEDAIQKQSTDEGVLRPEQPEVGLQEVVEGDQKPESVTEEGKSEEKVKSKELSDKIKGLKIKPGGELNISITGLEPLVAKIGQAVWNKSMDFLAKEIENGTAIGKAIENTIKYIDGLVGNKDWGRAELKKALLKALSSQGIRKLNKDRKSAINNIKAGKFGSLTNTVKSNKETIVEHETKKVKVLNFAMLFPSIVKKAVSPILFKKYSRALSSLTGRGKAIETKVSAQEVADLYDQIIEDYTNFAEIQNAINNGDTSVLTDEQIDFFNKNEEKFSKPKVEKKDSSEEMKEEERQDLESETMDLIPSMRESAKSYDAKSMSFDIIRLFSTITPSDLKMLSNAELNNLKRVLDTIVLDEDIPSFANEAQQTIIANRNKALSYNISERYNKTGFNRIPLRRMATKITDSIRDILKKIPFVESSNIQSRASRFPLVFSDAANKIYGMLPQYVDAVQNNYKSIPIYNYIFSAIDKAEGAFMSRLEDVSEKFQKAEEKLFSKSKNIDESYRKIHFAFLQIQAWGNPGNKKVKNGIISFTENIDSDGSPYTDRERKQYKAFLDKYKDYQFIVADDKVVVLDADGNDKTSTYFTKEELAAYNSIRSELDIQKTRAEETSLFNNKNAMPFVNYYFPEGNFSKTASARPLSDDPLHNNFNKSSVKSKNLEEKTTVAHPVAHNPIAIALASIRSTEMQYQLLNPIQISRKTISGVIADNNKLFRGATGKGKARLHELGKVYNNISDALDTLVEHLVNANAGRPDAMDNVFDLLTNTFYIGALASGVRTIADLGLNLTHLIAAEPSALLSGLSQRKTIKSIIKDNDIKDPDKFYRDILTYIDASQIARLMGVVNLTSVRSEFQAEGAGENITRKDVESEASKTFRKVTDVLSPLATPAKTLNQALMSVSDNMPALNFYIGVFSSEFQKATGQEFDYEKAGNNDADYMLKNSDAILFSSMIANFKLSSYLGSKNISAKSPVVVSAMRGQSGNQLATKIYNRMNYLFRQFIMGSVTQFNTSLNNIVEAESLGDVSKQARIMLGSGLRTSLYQAFSTSMLIGLWGLIKGDDEDEEIIKDNSDKLSNDDDFVKELFTIGDEMKVLDESFEGVDKSDNVAFDEFMKKKSDIRDKVLSLLKKNSDFRDLFDANYRFFAREVFSIKINNLSNNTKEMNDYGKSDIDNMLDGIKNKKVTDIKVLENNLAFLHSERGRSLMIDDFRDDAVDKIEKHLRDRGYYLLWDKSVPLDEFDATTPEGAFRSACLDITADNLLKHRDNSFLSNFEKGIVETSVNLGVGTRGSMPVKVASYGVELINRKSKEISRGYYDFDKDRYNYATPDIGLSDKKFDARKIFDTFGIPEMTVLLKSIQRNGITDAALITFRVPGVSDVNRIKGTIRKDEIYNNTRGKFEENLFKEYLEKKLYMTKEEVEKKEEEEKKYNSRLIQDKDKIRLKE